MAYLCRAQRTGRLIDLRSCAVLEIRFNVRLVRDLRLASGEFTTLVALARSDIPGMIRAPAHTWARTAHIDMRVEGTVV
jgi:hypothetical protein